MKRSKHQINQSALILNAANAVDAFSLTTGKRQIGFELIHELMGLNT